MAKAKKETMAKAKKKENKLVIRKDNAVAQELVNDLTWHQNKLLCVLPEISPLEPLALAMGIQRRRATKT